jgi:hypothetical protein
VGCEATGNRNELPGEMKLIDKYKTVIAVVLPILILVLIRSFWPNQFKVDAIKWAEPSFTTSNIIPVNQIGKVTGDRLIINLDKATTGIIDQDSRVLNISSDSVLVRNNLKMIRRHDGPVMLISSQVDISARIWMILSQMGCENLYIITNDTANEVLKYKFRPDTLVRPEL